VIPCLLGNTVKSWIEGWKNETDLNEIAQLMTIAHGDDEKVNGQTDASKETESQAFRACINACMHSGLWIAHSVVGFVVPYKIT
jgi:hypothetical protein